VLKKHFGNIVNVEFTAGIEEKLDAISDEKTPWRNVIKEFYKPFEINLASAEKNLERQKIEPQKTDILCPNCGKPMVIRDSRSGQFLGCSGYPDCKITMRLGKDGKAAPDAEETGMKCDKCASPLVKKVGFRGKPYIVCKNPECKATYNIDKNGNKVLKPEPEKTDIKCEKCGSMMLKRIGKRGPFLTCSAFPKCRNLQWIKQDKPRKAAKAPAKAAKPAAKKSKSR
jgi:DNA topoisomerase-1